MTLAIVFLFLIAGSVWIYLRSRQGSGGPQQDGKLAGSGTFEVPVTGESHYQDALESICGKRTAHGVEKYVEAQLILDDKNPYDSNAVRVEILGSTVGYLTKTYAPIYRQKLKGAGVASARATFQAVVRGGWDRGGGDSGSFGVWLDIA